MTKFLFIDKETLGTDEREHCIIQVAAIMMEPGSPPKELGRTGDIFIRPPVGALAKAHPFAEEMHRKSGILEKAVNEGLPLEVAEQQLIDFVGKFVAEDEPMLFSGNSVWFDKLFARQWMPKLFGKAHYRICDITSVSYFIELFTGNSPMDWEKKKAHTSEADLEETLHEAHVYAKRLGLI